MNITLRLEQPQDCLPLALLIREAFWKEETLSKTGVGCDEHCLAHHLRLSPLCVSRLNYVAEVDGELAGSVIYSTSYVKKPDGSRHTVLNFGPLSVLPRFQKRGVGSALMRHTLKKAARMGFGSVIFFGHPTYYPRFGFREAGEFGITTDRGETFPAFMAMELIYGDLDGVTGTYHQSPLFELDPELVREYDRALPPGSDGLFCGLLP